MVPVGQDEVHENRRWCSKRKYGALSRTVMDLVSMGLLRNCVGSQFGE